MALELRKAGVSFRDIALTIQKEMQLDGYSKSSAYHDVEVALSELKKHSSAASLAVIALELERLDAMWQGIYPQATAGQLEAIDRALRIQERRAKYLGLDSAARWEVTGKDGGPVETVQETEYDPKMLAAWERILLAAPAPADEEGAGA